MSRYSVLLFVCFITVSCVQQGRKYLSDGEYYSEGTRGYGICDLFRLTTDSVYDDDRKGIHIKRPVGIKFNSSAWGAIYSGAAGKTKWNTYFIIGDFDSLYSTIVFDKNKNCDFTDDTLFTIQKDTSFDIVFKNPQDQRLEYRYKLKFYHGPVDSSVEKFHNVMTYKKGVALPATYILFSKQFNIKKVRLPDGNIVSLRDAESDGIFTGIYDKVVAGDLAVNPSLLRKPLQCKEAKYGAELPFKNNTYKLIGADKYGNHISLIRLNKIVDTSEKLTVIIYRDENSIKRPLKLNGNKQYSIFYIWGTWCIGCLYQSKGFAEVISEYSNKANFYTLNVGDSRDKMIKYISNKKYPFQPYQVSTETASKKLFAEAFPTFIVADNHKRILLRTSSVDELKKFLSY